VAGRWYHTLESTKHLENFADHFVTAQRQQVRNVTPVVPFPQCKQASAKSTIPLLDAPDVWLGSRKTPHYPKILSRPVFQSIVDVLFSIRRSRRIPTSLTRPGQEGCRLIRVYEIK